MNTNNPFMNTHRYEEEDAVDAMEMAPSDTSYDQQLQYTQQHQNSKSNLAVQNPQIISQPQLSNQSSQKSLQNSSQVVFPPRQFPQSYQQQYSNNQQQQQQQPMPQNYNQTPTPQQMPIPHKFVPQQQQQQYQQTSNVNKIGDQSQSMLNLSDSVDHNTNLQQNIQLNTSASYTNQPHQQQYIQQQNSQQNNNNNTSLISDRQSLIQNQQQQSQPAPPLQQQQQSSALVRQLSEKVRSQAERLQKLDQYKQLCERRLLEIDPKHPLPVLPQHMGQKSFSQPVPELPPSVAEIKRQLAIKEQDLQYSKQRNEKLIQEIEVLKKQNDEKANQQQQNTSQINIVDNNPNNISKHSSQTQIQQQQDTQDALRKEIQLNEQLQKQLEILNQGNILDKIKQLEDEKNALLDYIEENIEKSHQNTNRSLLSAEARDTNDKVKQLEYEKSKLFQLCENLKYQEANNRSKIVELEEQLQSRPSFQELNDLKDQLEAIQSRYNTKCDDYCSLVKQIDPNFQENTFGNIEDLQQKLLDVGTLQKELDFNKEHFESTIGNIKRERDQMKARIDSLDQRNMDLEDQLRRAERDKDEIRMRAKEQYQGESERVDELLYENDNLRKELERLQQRLKTLQENSTTLQETLNETQQELENLVNEHEKLSEDYQRAKTQCEQFENERERYKSLNSDGDKELTKLRNEIIELRKETARQRDELSQNQKQISTLNDQVYRADMDNRDLKHQLSNTQHDLTNLQTHLQDRQEKQAKDWEHTIGDLTRELKYVQGELTEKENIFQRVEQELRVKLMNLEEATQEKSELRRRVEDLQSELRHIQTAKIDKEEKLKMQIHKNEQLLEELERINEAYTTVKDEKEATLVVKVEKEKEIEYTQRQLQKMRKVAERSLKSIKTLSKTIIEFSQDVKLKPQITGPALNHTNSLDGQSQEFEPLLLDIEQYVYHITEATNIITVQYKSQQKTLTDLKSENLLQQQKIQHLEQQCKSINEDECDVRERMRFMQTEIEQLRDKLRVKEEEKKEQYHREDKIQRQNQAIKQQLEVCRKEQEKLLMQIKSLLVEKERLIDENKQRIEVNESDNERVKTLEVKLSQLYQQKEQILCMLERIRDGMPTDSLQRLLSEILDSIHESFRIEEDYQQCEAHLLQMEGELRTLAKKENQGITLLSTKVINMRKDVESKRVQLREIQDQRVLIEKRRESLEQELKCTELSERRRCDVALDTEKALTEAKFEISNLKREVQFVNANRKDLEIALSSVQEEKKMVERELLSLRAQLQMKINNSKQSTMMNINPASSLPPLHTGAALRQGDLLFAQVSQNISSYNQTGNNFYQQQQQQHPTTMSNNQHYDSLISQKTQLQQQQHHQYPINLLGNNNNNKTVTGGDYPVNQTLHFTEQKPQHNLELLTDRFTSAEKNQRMLLTAGGGGGMNSARGVQRTTTEFNGGNNNEDAENIEPNSRLNLAQQRLPQSTNSGSVGLLKQQKQQSHHRSFQSLDQPLQMQQQHTSAIHVQTSQNQELASQNTSMQLPLSRPPLGTHQNQHQSNNINHSSNLLSQGRNSYKRPLSVRSGSMQNLARGGCNDNDSLDGGYSGSVQDDREYFDDKEYPIRNSLKQRLNQVKNVFSAIRKNLEDQTESKIEEQTL